VTVTPTAVNHSKPQINLKKMDKLKGELSFFQQLLKMERNEVRRNLLLGHIQNVEEQMLKLWREERDRKSKQLQNIQDAEAKNMKKE
jgi:hypothetical protein